VQVTGLYTTSAGHTRAGGVYGGIAVKLMGTTTKDHRLELTMHPSVLPGEVEVIVLHPEVPLRSRVRGCKQPLRVQPAAGIWANREDIGEPITYVS
jgi:hypothetical protein